MSFQRKTQWPSREYVWFLCYIRQLRVHVRHGLINYIDKKPKCRHLKKLICKGTLQRCLSVWVPLPILWPHTPLTHCILAYCILITYTHLHTEKGGSDEPERRLKGQQFTKLGQKYQHDWLYLQSINSDKHLPQKHPLQVYIFLDEDIWTFALASIYLISQWRTCTQTYALEQNCLISYDTIQEATFKPSTPEHPPPPPHPGLCSIQKH